MKMGTIDRFACKGFPLRGRSAFIFSLSLLLLAPAMACNPRGNGDGASDGTVPARWASTNGLGREGIIEVARKMSRKHAVERRRYVTVIDYSLSILSDRLFVVDLQTEDVVLQSPVSHAYNSGFLYASDFSNVKGSEKSCVGAFKTLGSYNGRFGYAMRLKGLEPGLNDRALDRFIVFHTYRVWPVYSQGCFVTPKDVNTRLIDLIKNGSLVYVHAP